MSARATHRELHNPAADARGRLDEEALAAKVAAQATRCGRNVERRIAAVLRDAGPVAHAKRGARIRRRESPKGPNKPPRQGLIQVNDGPASV